jgi:hypothetical protein
MLNAKITYVKGLQLAGDSSSKIIYSCQIIDE